MSMKRALDILVVVLQVLLAQAEHRQELLFVALGKVVLVVVLVLTTKTLPSSCCYSFLRSIGNFRRRGDGLLTFVVQRDLKVGRTSRQECQSLMCLHPALKWLGRCCHLATSKSPVLVLHHQIRQ